MKKQLLLIALLVFSSIPSIWPLFSNGFFPMHDDTQVARVYEMKEALGDGAFPVRWVENLGYGYGYPIFNFYAPLAYYVGAFFNIVGFDSLVATKIMIGLGTLAAGVSMYLLAREFWGNTGAMISGLLYVYAPYHALNIYVRGAIAELWSYAFIPLVLLGLYKLYELTTADNKKIAINRNLVGIWIALTSLSYATIVLSHNLTAFMITPFIVFIGGFIWVVSLKRKQLRYAIPLSIILAIMLSAFYWLPVITEMKYTNVLSVVGGGSDYRDHFVCVSQLWNGMWGYAGSAPGCDDGMSFKVGKLHITLAVLALITLFLKRKDKKVLYGLLTAYMGLFITMFLTLEYSKPVWDLFHQMSFFQFPWRFLSLVSLCISFIGGAVILLASGRVKIAFALLVGVAVVFINQDIFVPSSIISRTASEYTAKTTIQWETTKMSDEYLPQGFQKPKTKDAIPTGKIVADPRFISIKNLNANSQSVSADINAKRATVVNLNIAYFPAWKMYLNGKETTYKNTSTGLQVSVPQGDSKLRAVYVQTPMQQIGNIISITGVILLITAIIIHRKDKRKVAKIT